jgi:hypothetical protein
MPELLARSAEQSLVYWYDEADFICNGDKFGGRYQAFRPPPPAQCFKTNDLSASKADYGLVIDKQLAVFKTSAKIGL